MDGVPHDDPQTDNRHHLYPGERAGGGALVALCARAPPLARAARSPPLRPGKPAPRRRRPGRRCPPVGPARSTNHPGAAADEHGGGAWARQPLPQPQRGRVVSGSPGRSPPRRTRRAQQHHGPQERPTLEGERQARPPARRPRLQAGASPNRETRPAAFVGVGRGLPGPSTPPSGPLPLEGRFVDRARRLRRAAETALARSFARSKWFLISAEAECARVQRHLVGLTLREDGVGSVAPSRATARWRAASRRPSVRECATRRRGTARPRCRSSSRRCGATGRRGPCRSARPGGLPWQPRR